MGMMDHGFLQLRRPVQGRWRLDCRQAILILTSNAGATDLADRVDGLDLAPDRVDAIAREVLRGQGMPEWILGRQGHIAVYRPLPHPALAEIATLEVARLADEFGLELMWVEPEVVVRVLAEADAATTGARAVRTAAQRVVEGALARHRSRLAAQGDDGAGLQVVLTGTSPECRTYAEWAALALDVEGDDPEDGPTGPTSAGGPDGQD
jgi:ATP-dependent Clp protease ATP-binding subunit ClpA